MDLLNFTEAPVTDGAIEEYEYHEYEPITGTNLKPQERSGSLFRIKTYLLIRVTAISW